MTATKINLNIEQGATFHFEAALKDANSELLTVGGITANAMMRKSFESNTAYSFDTTLVEGSLSLDMTANATANIVIGRYVYDVKFSTVNDVTRVLEGLVTVTGQVTKS